MRKKKLMSRQKQIIQILTKSTSKNPITISTIAESLNISDDNTIFIIGYIIIKIITEKNKKEFEVVI